MADIPPYILGDDNINYNTELNQTLSDNIGQNGLVTPTLTPAQVSAVFTTMPDGAMAYVLDPSAVISPGFIGKVNGVVVRFTTGAYP